MRLNIRIEKEAAMDALLRSKQIQIRKKLSAVLSGLDTLLADAAFLRLLKAAKIITLPNSLLDKDLRRLFAEPRQEDLLNLVLAKGYVEKLLASPRVASYIRRWATQLVDDIESLNGPAPMDCLGTG